MILLILPFFPTNKKIYIPAVFVKIFGVIETADSLVIEMELVDGSDLFQTISNDWDVASSEAQASKFVYCALLGIEYMQNLGIAHRDIKLANLMVAEVRERDESTPAKWLHT